MAVGPICLAEASPAGSQLLDLPLSLSSSSSSFFSSFPSSYSELSKVFRTSASPLKCPFLRALSSNCPFLKSISPIISSPLVQTSGSKAKSPVPSEHPQIHRNEPSSPSSVHHSDSDAAGPIDVHNSELSTELSINGISLDDKVAVRHVFPEADVSALLPQKASAIPLRYANRRSSIMVISISVHTAPVQLREKLSIPEADWPSAIKELCDFPHIEEASILSTCNRMEVYVVALSWQRGIVEVLQWMSKTSGIPEEELREHLVVLQNKDATQHLFKVASGLDSLVLGEGQILSQVKHVLQVSQAEEGFGRILTGLFKQAISAGKRVRSETSIGTGAVSVSSAAVELMVSKVVHGSRFSAARVLIVGAGKMAKLLVQCLISKGCTRMVLVNRGEQKVQELQSLFPEVVLEYHPLQELTRCVGEADVVFTCTASDSPLLFKSSVRDLHPAGVVVSGVRHFVDISVPRNVSECVAELASAALYNVDHLEEVVAANKEKRSLKALEAQAIIEEETKSFEIWRDSLETVPTIKKLRAYAEKIRQGEVEKCLGKMKDNLTPQSKKLVEELSRAIVNKLLHGPMTHLRYDGKGEQTIAEILENKRALERIFELQQDAGVSEQQMKQVIR